MVGLYITIEEENFEKILEELKEPEVLENKPKDEVEEMDTYGSHFNTEERNRQSEPAMNR